ncbi:hypothetical protein [Aeropyrum pernix]|nr:hypothetical protein [Aeropyrum pernix]
MSKTLEIPWMLYRRKGSYGPDVEVVLMMPISVAIEDKLSLEVALREFGQVLNYYMSGSYDAVFIRINDVASVDHRRLALLEHMASQHGIGVLVGGSPYSAFTESDVLKLPAVISMKGNPLRVYRRGRPMTPVIRKADDFEQLIESALRYRSFFRAESAFGR